MDKYKDLEATLWHYTDRFNGDFSDRYTSKQLTQDELVSLHKEAIVGTVASITMTNTNITLLIAIDFMIAMCWMLIVAIRQTNRGLNEIRDIARITFARMTKDELRKVYKDSEYKAFKKLIEEELTVR